MKTTPYLYFLGQSEEAFDFYKSVFDVGILPVTFKLTDSKVSQAGLSSPITNVPARLRQGHFKE